MITKWLCRLGLHYWGSIFESDYLQLHRICSWCNLWEVKNAGDKGWREISKVKREMRREGE